MEMIYKHINDVFDDYINEGINPEHFLNYLNNNVENFEYMYNRLYRKLTLDKIQFDSESLKEAMKDVIRNNIYLLNDLTK